MAEIVSRSNPKTEVRDMRISLFDQVVAILMTGILFLGPFVAILAALWIWHMIPSRSIEVNVVAAVEENPEGRGDHAEGFERDFDPPGADEVEQLLEPSVQDTLTAVTDAVTTVAASLESIDSKIDTSNVGSSNGDSRQAGPEGEGDDIVPRFQRWQIKFAAKNLDEYSRMLDYFDIELGAAGGNVDGVDYAKKFSSSIVKRRDGSGTEKRLWFRWTEGNLKKFDEQLIQKAGISLQGDRFTMQFYEKQLSDLLAQMELEYATKAGFPSVKQIGKTIFESQPTDKGFAFKIIDQRYRVPKR